MNVVVLIPALRPGRPLLELVQELARSAVAAIVVVDDGSGPDYRPCFDECAGVPRVEVLRHAQNQGKGAALKTGIRRVLEAHPERAGVVTADADGQHHPEDILRLARRLTERGDTLVLGAREFGPGVPLRNRLGNLLARAAVRRLIGAHWSDTQTGLRGIPRSLLPHLLEIPSNGYEFELDMLIAARHRGCPILEAPIRTIYDASGQPSHFNPLRDSVRISFVLLRFTALSLATALLDNLVFSLLHGSGLGVAAAQAGGRLAAVLFNYPAARRAVFLSREPHRTLLPKYLLLVVASSVASYHLMGLLGSTLALDVLRAKMLAESLLFALNFIIQRDFVFTRRTEAGAATDWDRYYASTPLTARLARRYTAGVLVAALKRCGAKTLVELGGANSCFAERILTEVRPHAYHVVDINQYGMELLRRRLAGRPGVVLHRQDVLALSLDLEADAVFSVGLIEHFPPEAMRRAVLAHLEPLRPGGHALLSFPTPTRLYRAARRLSELSGLWRFPDERPLARQEVLAAVGERGQLVSERILWPLVFTQRMMVIRKLPS